MEDTTDRIRPTRPLRPFVVAGLALLVCAVGDACTRADTRADTVVPGAEAPLPPATNPTPAAVAVAPAPTAPPVTTTPPPVTTTPPPVTTTPPPVTTTPPPVTTTPPPVTTTPPASPVPTTPPPATTEAAPTWDGVCGPNDPMPADAQAITEIAVDVTGQGGSTSATTYRTADGWTLRIDGQVVSDEIALDAPGAVDVRVVTGVDLSGIGAHEVLVAVVEDGPFTEFELFGNHDGCLFRYEASPGEPLRFHVGVDDHLTTMSGLACHTDEWGSFITSRSALSNGDGTWNIVGTSYTRGAPFELEAGDGGHQFAVRGDHPAVGTLANVECGDVEPGTF